MGRGKVVTGLVEDFVPNGPPDPSRLQNIFYPSNTTLTIAKPVSSHIAAFVTTFENQASSAFSASFRWQA